MPPTPASGHPSAHEGPGRASRPRGHHWLGMNMRARERLHGQSIGCSMSASGR